MRRSSWRERLSYWFDSVMARGTGALIGLLAAASAAAILVISVAVAALQLYPTRLPSGFADLSLPELLWGSLTRMLSSGSFRNDEGWGFRLAMLVATLCGLVLVASLIGIISNAFDRRVLELRRGRSRVLESGHTLIVGWNATVLPMIAELATAAAEGRRSTVVVLSPRDKVAVEEEVRTQFGRLRGIRLIVRTGSPIEPSDLRMASPETARSIVVVSPEASPRPDIEVIKTVVVLSRRLEEYGSEATVFAELRRSDSLEAALLAGEGRARWVVSEEIIALLTLHSVRDRGISRLTRDLLDFARDEFVLVPAASLAGSTYADAQLSFPRATLVGILNAAGTRLNPPAESVIDAGDTLVVIAADSRSTATAAPARVDESRIRGGRSRPPRPSRTLVLGSHSGLGPLLAALGQYFPVGSSALVVTEATDVVIAAPDVALEIADTTSRAVLERLDIPSFDHVIVLPYRDALGEQEADAHSLVTVLHVRDIRDRAGADVAIVTEVLDDRNREIIGGRDDGDVIVSGLLVSRLLTQLATTPELADVFEELFSARGSEPHLRDADELVDLGSPVDAATLVAAAAARGETFLGILRARGAEPMTLNPPKTAQLDLAAGDRVIVLADQ